MEGEVVVLMMVVSQPSGVKFYHFFCIKNLKLSLEVLVCSVLC